MAEKYTQQDGRRLFEEDRATALAGPSFEVLYAEEAAKKELWLQLVEARQASGLTQQQAADRMGIPPTQVALIEQRGYEGYTLRTLRRYLAALGGQFSLHIGVECQERPLAPRSG